MVHGAACIQEGIIWMRENLRVSAGIGEFHLSYFKRLYPNGSLISGTPQHFNVLLKQSRPFATASKQTVQNVVMATVEFCLNNTK